MSAEHTPLTVEPEGTAVRIGNSALNGQQMEVYAEPNELPCGPERRAICERHLETGLQGEMMSDFWLAGCDFDKALEEGIVRVQFSCAGLSRVMKKCGLTLTQYDSEGNKLNMGKFGQRID